MAKYQEWLTNEGLLKIEGWAMDGLTGEQIARNMGIAESTLYAWQKKFTIVSEALKKGKEVVDRQVENALLKRALGYYYIETTSELVDNELVITKQVEKHMAPDVTAQIYWLKNRKPEEWRDRRVTIEKPVEREDDGFIEALNEMAKEDWEENDAGKEESSGTV